MVYPHSYNNHLIERIPPSQTREKKSVQMLIKFDNALLKWNLEILLKLRYEEINILLKDTVNMLVIILLWHNSLSIFQVILVPYLRVALPTTSRYPTWLFIGSVFIWHIYHPLSDSLTSRMCRYHVRLSLCVTVMRWFLVMTCVAMVRMVCVSTLNHAT